MRTAGRPQNILSIFEPIAGAGSRQVIETCGPPLGQPKDGGHKILKKCTLPLTGMKVVNRIVTELAVIEVTDQGLVLREIAADTTLDAVIAATGATLTVAEPLGRF